MFHDNVRNGDGKEWKGHQQLENLPSLIAQALKVTEEKGRSCLGSLTLFDTALNRNRQYLWSADYGGEQGWSIIGREVGVVGQVGFSQNKAVNYQTAVFVRDRLNDMISRGCLFQPQLKQPTSPSASAAEAAKGPPPAPAAPIPASLPVLPGAAQIAPPMVIVSLPVNRIRPNPQQPRKYFRKYALRELAESLKAHKQRQIIEVIRVYGDPKADYELVIGERRWRAAIIGGITHLNALVRDQTEVPDKKAQHRLCFVADFHREGYSKLEIALALMEEKENGLSAEELRKICGRSIAWVYQHLALNDLIPELKKLLDPNLPGGQQLSFNIGCRIARFPKEQQMEAHRQVSAITGSRLQLIELNKLLNEAMPDRPAGRPRKPADYVRNLRRIVPRTAADALIADGYSDKVFGSLLDNASQVVVETMLGQIDTAINGLRSIRKKIEQAEQAKK